MGLVFGLNGVHFAGKRPGIISCFPAKYLSGHAQVIGRIPLNAGAAQVDEPAG
jgi:hypothetical protein